MGTCTSCTNHASCEERKGAMRAHIERTLARLYPTRRWGEPEDRVRFGGGAGDREIEALAGDLARGVDASVFARAGDDDEACHYLYVLCVGREPSLVQQRDGGVLACVDDDLCAREELYLRVCVSTMARVAMVQEVVVTSQPFDAALMVTEAPRPGVYAAALLARMQRVVAVLGERSIVHLDFAALAAPPPGFAFGDYAARYGGEPTAVNFLFYPQPSTTVVTTWIEPGRAPDQSRTMDDSSARSPDSDVRC